MTWWKEHDKAFQEVTATAKKYLDEHHRGCANGRTTVVVRWAAIDRLLRGYEEHRKLRVGLRKLIKAAHEVGQVEEWNR